MSSSQHVTCKEDLLSEIQEMIAVNAVPRIMMYNDAPWLAKIVIQRHARGVITRQGLGLKHLFLTIQSCSSSGSVTTRASNPKDSASQVIGFVRNIELRHMA